MEKAPDFRSPDGRFLVEWEDHSSVGNSTFVQPRVTDTRTGDVLLDLWGETSFGYFGWVVGTEGPVIEVAVRRVQRTVGCTVVIDADARTYALRDLVRNGKGLDLVRERLGLAGLVAA